MTIYTDFSQIPLFRYGLIMADPAWLFALRSEKGIAKSPQAHYSCMSVEEIAALPVANLAAPDCLLWLWATHPMLPDAIDVLRAWSFNYVTSGVWGKITENGRQRFGTGYRLRSTSEPYLIGSIGRPPIGARNIPTLFNAPAREHSRKPELGYRNAAAMAPPRVPRLELFAREERHGWDAFGDEVGKFEGAA